MDFTRMQQRVWAKTILQAAYSTIQAGRKLPASLYPAIKRALDIMEQEDDT